LHKAFNEKLKGKKRKQFFFFKLIIDTRVVQKVLQVDIQKIHKALEFDFI